MIKLSELLKQRSDISGTNFRENIVKPYFQEIILDYISDITAQENIKECEVTFNKNELRKDLTLDEVINIVSGEAELKIIECVNNLICYNKIKEYTEEELETIELEEIER